MTIPVSWGDDDVFIIATLEEAGEELERLHASRERLTFERFQRVSLERMADGFRHTVDNWSLLEWAGAAAGEMGEVANVCKKLKRKAQKVGGTWADRDPDVPTLLAQLADEIGDTLAYLSLLASAAGLDMGACAAGKFDKVSEAIGWPGERLGAQAPAASEEPARCGCSYQTIPGTNVCSKCYREKAEPKGGD